MRTPRTTWIGSLSVALGLAALSAPGAVKVWQPTANDGFASTAANWSDGALPAAGDDIVLNGTSSRNLVWDAPSKGLPVTVNSWRQEASYTGRVTISTLYPAPGRVFTNFLIRGDLTLNGGSWIPPWNNATNGSRLAVTVGGNFTLAAGAALNAGGTGYARGGPGFPGAHGGNGRAGAPTYDPVTEPVLPGSGSGGHPGGGAMLLTVAGASLVNGALKADGTGWYNGGGGSAGGSVLLRSGTLAGTGAISANGGTDGWQGGGSGGRIALILTRPGADFGAFAVSNVTAWGTPNLHHGKPGTAAGTVYLEASKDGPGNGQVIVGNNGYEIVDSRTSLPPVLNPRDRLEGTRWLIRHGATVRVTTNTEVNTLTVAEDGLLDLGTYTIRTRALTLNETAYPPGLYRAEDLGYRMVLGAGTIAVQLPGAPEVANRATSRLTPTTAAVSGTLLTGADADTTCTLFWGPVDGGRKRDGWARRQVVTPDTNGNLAAAVTNLAPNTGVWFTFHATNSKGEWWADPPLFAMTAEPTVSVVASTIVESTLAPVTFLLSRPAACAQGPLTLSYELRGTASNGVDYLETPDRAVLLAPGQTQAVVRVFPTFDLATEPARTVVLDLNPGAHPLGSRSSATVTIADARGARPDWWDSVPLRQPQVTASASLDAHWNALVATNLPLTGRPMTDWFIAGPFDGTNSAGFDIPYPPESAMRRDAMQGKGGVTVNWQEWKTDQPCPVRMDTQDAVFYLARTFTPETPDGFLYVTVDDRARVWVDGQPVHTNVTIWNPTAIPVHLAPGPHRLLVKVLNTLANWSCSVGWSPVDPRRLEIKMRSLQAARSVGTPASLLPQAERLVTLARDTQDGATFEFWAAWILANTPDRGRAGNWVRGWAEQALASPALFEALVPLAANALGREADPAARETLATVVGDLAAARSDPVLAARAFRSAHVEPNAWISRRMLGFYGKEARADLGYWLETYLDQEPNEYEREAFIRSFTATATDFTLPLLYASLENAFRQAARPDRRIALARRYMALAFERNDTGRLHAFLQTYGANLGGLLPWDTTMWRLRLALMDLDQDAAKAALEQAAVIRPGYRRKPEYSEYLYRILKIRASATTPTEIDFSVEAIGNNLQKLARGESPDTLNRFIRDTLTQKGAQVVADEGDRDRFIGSKTLYRALCEPYRPAYAPYLDRYTAQVEQQGTANSRLAAARLRVQAGLTPPPAAAPSPLPVAGLRAAAFAGARPLVSLPPGVLEWAGEASRAELKGEGAPDLYAAATFGDLTIIQNSRAIAALRGDRVVWSRAVPLSPAWAGTDAPLHTGARFLPAAAGEVVAARFLFPDQGCSLVGLGRADGRFLWRWADENATPVSSPATWGTNRLVFITSQPGETTFTHRLALVVAEAATGRTLYRLPLGLAQRDLFVNQNWRDRRLDFYRNVPQPTVEGSVAYFDTAAGLIGAVDLADEGVLWLRVYPRQLDPKALPGRQPGSPLLAQKTALFAPFDSNQLLLVEKRTGRLVARRTDVPWTSVAAGGPGTASVLTGNAAYWFGLDRLDETRRLPGRSPRHIQSFGDGVLVQEGAVATLYTPAGAPATTTKLPPGVQAASLAEGQARGFGGVDHGTFVALEAGPTQAGQPVVVTAPPADTPVPLTRSVRMPSGALLLAGSILTRFDDQGRRTGELAAADDGVAADAAGRIALLHTGRLWLYGGTFGRPEAIWPADPADGSNAVLRLAASDGTLYALAAGGPGGSNRLLRVAEGRPLALGLLPPATAGAADFVVSEGTSRVAVAVLLGGNAGQLFDLKRSAGSGDSPPSFDRIAEGAPGQFLACPDEARRRTVILRASDRRRWIVENGTVAEDTVPGTGPLWADWANTAGQLAACQTKTNLYVFEPATGLSLDLRNARCWMVNGTTVYGAFCPPEAVEERARAELDPTLLGGYQYAKGDAPTGVPFRVDLRTTAEPATGTPAFMPLYDRTQRAGQLMIGTTAALVLRTHNEQSGITALVWEGASPEARSLTLPRIPVWSGISQAGPRLIVANETPLTDDEFRRCLSLETIVARRSAGDTQAVPRVDGFLDEWQDADFTTTPRGRYALRRGNTPDDLWLAVEIADPARVERLAAADLDEKLLFILTPGPNADFAMDSSDQQTQPVRLRFPGRGPKVDAAWSFTPGATRLAIEIHVSEAGIRRRERKHEPSAEARTFGDLAFRLVWQADPFSPAENLLGVRAVGPLSFERVLFGN